MGALLHLPNPIEELSREGRAISPELVPLFGNTAEFWPGEIEPASRSLDHFLPISVNYVIMEIRISATELARRLGDVLGKIRYRADSFVVERNGEPVARLSPLAGARTASVADGLRAWREAAPGDEAFADDLEKVNRADRPPANPWAS